MQISSVEMREKKPLALFEELSKLGAVVVDILRDNPFVRNSRLFIGVLEPESRGLMRETSFRASSLLTVPRIAADATWDAMIWRIGVDTES